MKEGAARKSGLFSMQAKWIGNDAMLGFGPLGATPLGRNVSCFQPDSNRDSNR